MVWVSDFDVGWHPGGQGRPQPDPSSCDRTRKDSRAWQKDLAKHSKLTKAIVCTQKGRTGDLKDWEVLMGVWVEGFY